ncbi:MAG TPA: prolyl oligopeptidase, partial [Candidatus Hydrogenedentes bacterium]|nr:prolyl oligopeptidase [Candidatus Hydrogenedentota bacterium]
APPVSEADMATLAREDPLPSHEEQDATCVRTIYLRRYAGPCRVTIFEGGHEGLPKAALAFLARHVRE